MNLDEYWRVFAQEGEESLASVEQCALSLENQPGSVELVRLLYRTIHTFKGNARVMGIGRLERLAHVAEDLIGCVRSGHVGWGEEISDLVLEFVDAGRRALAEVIETRADIPAERVADLEARLAKQVEAIDAGARPGAAPRAAPAARGPGQPEDVAEPDQGPSERATLVDDDGAHDPYDLSLDPGYVSIYFRLIEDKLGRLSEGLHDLAEDPEADRAALLETLEAVHHATDQMGYDRLLEVLEETAAQAEAWGGGDAGELIQLELAIFEELVAIQETVVELAGSTDLDLPDFACVFRSWHAQRLLADLAQLSETLDELAAEAVPEPPTLFRAARLLTAIRHACLSYGMARAGEATLGLADLVERVGRGELAPRPRLFELARVLAIEVGRQVSDDPVEVDETPLEAVLAEVEDFLAAVASGATEDDGEELPGGLGMPAELTATLTPESRGLLEDRVAAGDHVYSLWAPLESDPALMERVIVWLEGPAVHAITNSCTQEGGEMVYRYLLTSPRAPADFAADVHEVDAGIGRLEVEALGGSAPRAPAVAATPGGAPAAPPAVPEDLDDALLGLHEARESYLRIEADKVGRMMDLSGEVALAAGAIAHHPNLVGLELEGLRAAFDQLSTVVRELQELAATLRLVPIGGLFQRLRRLIRDLAKETGKPVRLHLEGEDLELDKVIVDHLHEPLLHLLRNAVDHGIEAPEGRAAAGKDPEATILVRAEHGEGGVVVLVRDDGRGLDREAILAKARALGWAEEDDDPGDEEIFRWITRPGFSTAAKVSTLSGRGVGLDAVRSTVEELRGRFLVDSSPGAGTRFKMVLPLTVAFLDAMVVRIGGTLYAVAIEAVHRVFQVAADEHQVISAEQNDVVKLADEIIPICRLGEAWPPVDLGGRPAASLVGKVMLVAEATRGRVGIPVEEIVGTQQVTIKPLVPLLRTIRASSGCALLPSGEVAIALDHERLHDYVR